jgi:PhoH-like ATPase
MRKNYILDANVLIHDPNSIFHFSDNTVIIPIAVISEIDRFKKEMSDRGYNARAVVRLLDSLRGERGLTEGVGLNEGGRLKVFCDRDSAMQGGRVDGDIEVLHVAQAIREAEPDTPVVIVTKDMNLRIRADALGLRAEDYESDHVRLSDVYTGQMERFVSPEELGEFTEKGSLPPGDKEVLPNEYVWLRASDGSRTSALGRVEPECRQIIPLIEAADGLCGVQPRNKEQYFAIDALLDERVSLVTLMGKAGTGKTLLALAAALHLTAKERRYRGALVCRPIIPVGRDVGYLPGDIEEKLNPWMKPVMDTVEFLLDVGGPIRGHSEGRALINSGVIEVQPLTYIRGRNISKRFVVIDEAQNLTPLEVKTVITRIGQEAKVVLTGDAYQIDNPYIDATSSGFTYLVNRFRKEPLAAHIELLKGERSSLAELAANLL